MKKFGFHIPEIEDIVLTVFGAVLCGAGAGMIKYSDLGMDAIGLFYDGIRNILDLSPEQIGTASYVVCAILTVFLLIVDRKYVSVGSLSYILFYGVFANLGFAAGALIFPERQLLSQIFIAALGLLILYVGLGLFIAIDIGVDVFTGVTLWLTNLTGWTLKNTKIVFDLSVAVIGFALGGTVGALTFITVVIGGPCVSFFRTQIQKVYFRKKIQNQLRQEGKK